MPDACLIMDSSERLISISVVDGYLITGAVVEQCTCKRQMIYTVDDIAYRQDVDALNKKIDTLAEQSHMNDISMCALQEKFPTVDEVNEVLTNNYALKSDIPPAVDLSTVFNKSDDWRVFYNDYVATDDETTAIDISLVTYTKSTNTLTFYDEYYTNSLIIFTDDDGVKHFIRFDCTDLGRGSYDNHVYLDEIYGKTYDSNPFDYNKCECTFNNVIIASNQSSAKNMTINHIYFKLDKLSPLETRIAALEAENATLKATINNMSSSSSTSTPSLSVALGSYRTIDNISVYTDETVETLPGDGYTYAKISATGVPTGLHLIGSYTDDETNEIFDFDIIWKTSYDQGTVKYHTLYDTDVYSYRLMYRLATRLVYAIRYNITNGTSKYYSLNLTHVCKKSDTLVLKSEYDAKIAALEARLAALENA